MKDMLSQQHCVAAMQQKRLMLLLSAEIISSPLLGKNKHKGCWLQCYCSFSTTISTVSALDQCDHKSCCICGSKHCLPAKSLSKNCQHVTFDSPTAVVKVSGVLPRPKLRTACFHLRWQKGQISSCRQEYLWWKLDQHGPKPVREWGLCDRELQTHSILQKNRAKNILKTIHHPKDTLFFFFFKNKLFFFNLYRNVICYFPV